MLLVQYYLLCYSVHTGELPCPTLHPYTYRMLTSPLLFRSTYDYYVGNWKPGHTAPRDSGSKHLEMDHGRGAALRPLAPDRRLQEKGNGDRHIISSRPPQALGHETIEVT